MHVHSTASPCSELTLKEIFEAAPSYRIECIVLTDHNVIANFVEEFKIARKYDIKVFLGYELTVLEGELLVYGLKNVLKPNRPANIMIEAIHRAGGVAVAAHPFREWPVYLGDKVYDLEVDGIEVSDRLRFSIDENALAAAFKKHVAATAGSDAHHLSEFGWCCTEFSDRIDTVSQLVEALKNQRCEPKLIR
ncbi:MAG: PHP domain-containing protein [Candidatus Odinarchaeota archaeon]